MEVIKKALRLFAKDLTNRDELNGYKHGLRGIRHLVSFQIGSKDNPDVKYLNFQTNDALSYYSFDKDTNNHVLKTLELDPEKDIKMTHYASNLLYNIIEPRKYIYGKKIGEELTILHFSEASLDHVSKPNIQFQNMTFKYQI